MNLPRIKRVDVTRVLLLPLLVSHFILEKLKWFFFLSLSLSGLCVFSASLHSRVIIRDGAVARYI